MSSSQRTLCKCKSLKDTANDEQDVSPNNCVTPGAISAQEERSYVPVLPDSYSAPDNNKVTREDVEQPAAPSNLGNCGKSSAQDGMSYAEVLRSSSLGDSDKNIWSSADVCRSSADVCRSSARDQRNSNQNPMSSSTSGSQTATREGSAVKTVREKQKSGTRLSRSRTRNGGNGEVAKMATVELSDSELDDAATLSDLVCTCDQAYQKSDITSEASSMTSTEMEPEDLEKENTRGSRPSPVFSVQQENVSNVFNVFISVSGGIQLIWPRV